MDMPLNLGDIFKDANPYQNTPDPLVGAENPELAFFNLVRNITIILFFALLVVWVVVALIGALKMITSAGGDAFGAGIKTIRNLLVGIIIFMLFLIAIIFVTGFFIESGLETTPTSREDCRSNGQLACKDGNGNLVCKPRSEDTNSCTSYRLENY